MTSFSLLFAPLVPWPWLYGLAATGLLAVGLALWTRRRGALLRVLVLATVLGALTDPSLVKEEREPLRDVVALVVDVSASQTIAERAAQTAAARAGLEQRLRALGNVEVRVIEAGRTDAESDGTRLFGALQAGLADVPPERVAAVLMVTDGVVHDVPTPAAYGIHAPLHVLVSGHPGERDRRIELVDAPRFGIVGKDQTLAVRVLDTATGGEPMALDVRRDGVTIARLSARPGEVVRVPVRIDHGGPNVVEAEVAALPDELTAINNKAVVTIEGVRDKLKVLLVSGEPHQGERTWRNLLKSDANVDLVHFTILRPPEKQDSTPVNELALIAFPTADLFARRINDFDLIIFDRYSNQSVLPPVYFDNIVRYVQNGGALLLAAGPDFSGYEGLFYSPLGRIAPARPDGHVIEQAFRAEVSPDGRKHPVTRGLPGADAQPPAWAPWFREIGANVIRGTNVLQGPEGKPLLVLSREDKGRVGLLLSDQMWLWARGYADGGPYFDILRRLAHWLMKEPELEEEALRARVNGRDIVVERQTLKDTVAPVTMTDPAGGTQTLELAQSEPGLWRATVPGADLGLWRASDGTLTGLVNVGPENPREYQEVVSTAEHLRPLAEATGGTVRRLAGAAGEPMVLPRIVAMRDAGTFGGGDWIGVRRTESSIVRGVGVAPLATGLWGLAALLGALLLAWLWEGRRRAA